MAESRAVRRRQLDSQLRRTRGLLRAARIDRSRPSHFSPVAKERTLGSAIAGANHRCFCKNPQTSRRRKVSSHLVVEFRSRLKGLLLGQAVKYLGHSNSTTMKKSIITLTVCLATVAFFSSCNNKSSSSTPTTTTNTAHTSTASTSGKKSTSSSKSSSSSKKSSTKKKSSDESGGGASASPSPSPSE